MITAISDIHLGSEESNKEEFKEFINTREFTDEDILVLLGDILDFGSETNWNVLRDNQDVLNLINEQECKKYYVIGNHDYLFNIGSELLRPRWTYFSERVPLSLESGGETFVFAHGYSLEVYTSMEPFNLTDYEDFCEQMTWTTNWWGRLYKNIWAWWNRIEKNRQKRHLERCRELAESSVREEVLDFPNWKKLIFGHTHDPYCGKNSANSGDWVENNSYIEIDDGDYRVEYY